MGRPMNYNDYAVKYAHTRWAVPWVLEPLLREVEYLTENSTVIEIGCGTGNYIIALSNEIPDRNYCGFDLSEEMLKVARSRSSAVEFIHGDAEVQFPFTSAHGELAFLVDVIHYIVNLNYFFSEAARILKPEGHLFIVTDSVDNIRNRSLTKYFPEILDIELDRYPSLTLLHQNAEQAGLELLGEELIEGTIDLDDAFISKLEGKCSSAMRLISDEEHQRGVERVRRAQSRGEKWFSLYTLIRYKNT